MKICKTIAIYWYHRKFLAVMFTVFAAILFVSTLGKAYATSACQLEVARIVSMQGIIELRRVQETKWQQADMNTTLCAGDMIRARSQSRAALRLSNDSMLRLNQKTSITFPALQETKGTSLLDLFEGAIHIITRTPKPFKIRTPFVNASVEGTEFFVGVHEDNAEVVVYEGRVSVSNDLGSLVLNDHEVAITFKDQAPRKEIIIRPTDAVQWALYYPAIADYWQRVEVPPPQDAGSLIQEAGRLLTVGQADEAKRNVQQVLQLEPNNSDAHALLAIIAVTQNEKDQALDLATKAVTLDQQSAAAYLALSYTQQAHFEIEAALKSVQKAITLDSDNALAWARVAELQMSLGDLDRALDSAQHAVNLQPDLAKTQTILGFANLLQIDTQTAKTIFTRAIALDQADPMPRLGLGLALIREGELEAGRIELEIAASLDPANSLIRSYLGKAYFEEKRYPLASTQFSLAKEHDPKDPTPWLYDAIQKQTQNRPIEALQDIQKSIELNDNRAVYRSKLLLDRDEAARGSSLARIFENLGFEKRALMETAKSLSFDPSNHSAHRFLSDTYAHIPRHEAARVSELLQAQLLQPINVNPVQPHMAVADLNIINNTGPSNPGFNEFAPLIERNKSQVVASGIVGNNGTLGNEVVLSKLYDRTSISLGQFHYETNGFRPNNDQNHNIYSAFIQHAFTPKFNVQAEFRTRETQHGDIVLNFNPDFFSQKASLKFKEDTVRSGFRYAITPEQDFIVSAMYKNRDTQSIAQNFGQKEVSAAKISNSYQIEAQHHLRKRFIKLVTGGGIYEIWSNQSCLPCNKDSNEQNHNLHLYSNINLQVNMAATLGVGYNSYKNDTGIVEIPVYHFSEVDPKIGFQWDVMTNLRLRAAWFETVRSGLIAQQTLEPTQVAGFNQLYDEPVGTRSRRKGAGLDIRISKDYYGGIEGSIRQLAVPILDVTGRGKDQGFVNAIENQEELLYRAYLYGSFNSNWSFTSELQYEKFSRNESPIRNLIEPNHIDTLSMPTSLNYFNPNGLFFRLTGTYVRQDLERLSRKASINFYKNTGEYPKDIKIEGLDSFYLFDASIGYRLPQRKGLISFEGRNLLDEDFYFRNPQFYGSQPIPPRYSPFRAILVQVTLNF
ncbi:tetratricopeptide repeat protein [Nitrosomonas sp.]|uniref:tetratricopeptide repeat protein n=1 Tax=Nitrosomonas sp. TaxID=42353 RepID=UPI0027308577|nr:tetratricopeptide repeat protein [Nitrosomonas sp.]MDP2223192.1 TonB-dependent receptor [Nitrosomonas sp.]